MLTIESAPYCNRATLLLSTNVNQRRVCKGGVAPLVDTSGNVVVNDFDKAALLNAQFSSVFTDDDGNLPYMDKRTIRTLKY